MIPIVEDYLSELIQGKLSYLKNNPNYLDRVLATSQGRIDRLKDYIQSKPIKVIKGYPRTPAELPSICILLSGEEETQDSLGDYGTDEDNDLREVTEQVQVVSTEGAMLPIPYVELTNKPVSSIYKIIDEGSGTEIDLSEVDIFNPDLGLVGFFDGMLNHGDTLSVTYTYKHSSTENMEVLYEANYRLEVWADNADLVVELYHLVKWAVMSGRDNLITERDLFRQKLSGADFEPAPNYFPTFVYRRALNFWCQFVASTPIEEVPFISGIDVTDTVSFDTTGE